MASIGKHLVGKHLVSTFLVLAASAASAQAAAPPAPAVGVVKAEKKPITETNTFIGRVQAIDRVNIVARVTAFVESVAFKDGQEVKKGDMLYRLERPPFEADLEAKQAVAAQMNAQLANADAALNRAKTLLNTPAGLRSNYDSALANEGSFAAQLAGAKAAVKQSQINLSYTDIASPIDGRTGRTAITPGNVVSPGSGTLVTIVSQDPMYVLFPVSVAALLSLRTRYVPIGGFNAVVVRITLPDGRLYKQVGKLNFVDNTVQAETDTLTLRATIANPPILDSAKQQSVVRELFDGEFVTVSLEGVAPVEVLGIPRAAVLTDQRGDYVYVVDAQNRAERRDIKLGQSTPTTASVLSGLKAGELVIAEGIQRVRAGEPVMAGPITPGPSTSKENGAAK
ncbi:MAG TPA: efflux RND transporter periplasmic adaptor subunit [Methylovirgula sp.]